MPKFSNIGQVIRHLRTLRGWTQGRAARAIGKKRTSLVEIEGADSVRLANLAEYASGLGYKAEIRFKRGRTVVRFALNGGK